MGVRYVFEGEICSSNQTPPSPPPKKTSVIYPYRYITDLLLDWKILNNQSANCNNEAKINFNFRYIYKI